MFGDILKNPLLGKSAASLCALFVLGCSNGEASADADTDTDTDTQTRQTDTQQDGEASSPEISTFASGLVHPWALEFLPDGRALVTERPGRLRYVDRSGNLSEPIAGLPQVWNRGQGGLLDVIAGPDFAQNQVIYFSYAEPGSGGTAGTAVARARLEGDQLTGVEVIFRQSPKVSHENHFGSRLAFGPQGNLFVTLAERFQFDPAQDNSNTLGTVVRIAPDGSVPSGNPFVGQNGEPEIWSYGHRNIEAASVHPQTGRLWVAEMGPRGGDELNLPQPGRNYGWPLVSWGEHYSGEDIPDPPSRPDLAQSIHEWTPVISPSGMIFYAGEAFPAWQGDVLIGGLTARAVVRLDVDGTQVTDESRIDIGQRIREVAQGPGGEVYLLTDEADGEILRLSPE